MSTSPSSQTAPAFKVHEVRTISTHNSYHGWPTVARLQNGELLVVVSAGRERHVCPFGQVHLLRSSDGGRTWSAPMVLDEKPQPRDIGYPSTVQLADGSLYSVWYEHLPGAPLATVEAARWTLG